MMTGQGADRWGLAATGAAGGALFWALIETSDQGTLPERATLFLTALVVAWCAATLAMAGPIGLKRSLIRGLGLGGCVAALLWLASLRYDAAYEVFGAPMSPLAAFLVASLPVPFLICQTRGNWRDYGALFHEAWSVGLRYTAAAVFVGIVWSALLVSNEVLKIVGITVIDDLLAYAVVPFVVSGAALGLGMAVIHELADLISPHLVVRLFRLLLPAVLLVMLVFLVALPFRGLSGLVSGLSPAQLLLVMVAAGVALVSVTIDQSDAEAAQSRFLLRSAQAMALVLPVIAGLAAWALWLRMAQHGLTPERLFVALVAGLGLAYGLIYALAVLRGAGWMGRIRRGNTFMALSIILVSALWLTPLFNAERLSAQNQLSRYAAGLTPVADLDIRALGAWGRPGAVVLASLAERAKEPAEAALAERLAGDPDPGDRVTMAAVKVLVAMIPVQPPTATGTRDTLLAGALDYQLRDWREVCSRPASDGGPACLMVVADLLPHFPGEEAMLILEHNPEYTEVSGLYLDASGALISRAVLRADGLYPTSEQASALLRAWAEAPPPLTPAAINQLGIGTSGLVMQP